MTNRVIIDIETAGFRWEEFSDEERAYFVGRARGDTEEERLKDAQDRLALSPWTGQVVAIGLLNPDTRGGRILLRWSKEAFAHGYLIDGRWDHIEAARHAVDNATGGRIEVTGFAFEGGLLAEFWDIIRKYPQIITYNGRTFDGPFLMLRSLILGVPVGRDLVPNRYHSTHIDLCDRLTCFGVFDRYAPKLDIVCRRIGIPSPKALMSGAEVEHHWRACDLEAIARYLLGDLLAEAELFRRYVEVLGAVHDLHPVAPPPADGLEVPEVDQIPASSASK